MRAESGFGFRAVLALVLMFGISGSLSAQDANPTSDNTKINQRDKSATEATADRQKNNTSDQEITRRIRRSLIKDKSLSMYAHNVKIVTRDGTVTLKGPVRSDNEKKTVEAAAIAIAGEGKVIDSLDIKPEH